MRKRNSDKGLMDFSTTCPWGDIGDGGEKRKHQDQEVLGPESSRGTSVCQSHIRCVLSATHPEESAPGLPAARLCSGLWASHSDYLFLIATQQP